VDAFYEMRYGRGRYFDLVHHLAQES